MPETITEEITRMLNYVFQASPHNKERIIGEVREKILGMIGCKTWTTSYTANPTIKEFKFNWFQKILRKLFKIK